MKCEQCVEIRLLVVITGMMFSAIGPATILFRYTVYTSDGPANHIFVSS